MLSESAAVVLLVNVQLYVALEVKTAEPASVIVFVLGVPETSVLASSTICAAVCCVPAEL